MVRTDRASCCPAWLQTSLSFESMLMLLQSAHPDVASTDGGGRWRCIFASADRWIETKDWQSGVKIKIRRDIIYVRGARFIGQCLPFTKLYVGVISC